MKKRKKSNITFGSYLKQGLLGGLLWLLICFFLFILFSLFASNFTMYDASIVDILKDDFAMCLPNVILYVYPFGVLYYMVFKVIELKTFKLLFVLTIIGLPIVNHGMPIMFGPFYFENGGFHILNEDDMITCSFIIPLFPVFFLLLDKIFKSIHKRRDMKRSG